jgi:acetolactate synthase small subunit
MSPRGDLQKHTIIALVEDRPGVLNRIASKWRQRGFNIESLAVGHSETPGLSRMTFVVDASTDADQVVKQVDKLVEVVNIRDISAEEGKVDAIFELLQDYAVIELVRTGRVAMLRGSAISHPPVEHEEPERYEGFEPPYLAK